MKSQAHILQLSLVIKYTNALFIYTQNNAGSHTLCWLSESQTGRHRETDRHKTEQEEESDGGGQTLPLGSSARHRKQLNVGLYNLSFPPEMDRAGVKALLAERRGWIA